MNEAKQKSQKLQAQLSVSQGQLSALQRQGDQLQGWHERERQLLDEVEALKQQSGPSHRTADKRSAGPTSVRNHTHKHVCFQEFLLIYYLQLVSKTHFVVKVGFIYLVVLLLIK